MYMHVVHDNIDMYKLNQIIDKHEGGWWAFVVALVSLTCIDGDFFSLQITYMYGKYIYD